MSIQNSLTPDTNLLDPSVLISKEQEAFIQVVENCITNSVWMGERIGYLLDTNGKSNVPNPLSPGDETAIAQKGLASTFQDGGVTFAQVVRLLHSAKGLSTVDAALASRVT